jgi:hypothetical protein
LQESSVAELPEKPMAYATSPTPFLPSLNYPGSSRYSVALTFPKPTPKTQVRQDYGVLDIGSGKVVSAITGQPYNGLEPRSGKQYSGGVETPAKATPEIDPNDPNSRYKPVDIVKSPAIAGATTDLLAQFKKSADASLQGLDDHLKTYNAAVEGAMARGNQAMSTEPFESNTRALQSRYNTSLEGSTADYAALNADNEAKMRAIETEARGILPQYDTAAENIAQRQEAALQNQIGRYKVLTGTPTSMGSAEQRMLLRGEQDIRLPLEQAKIGRQYDLLSGFSLPIQRELANRETTRISQFNPYVASQEYTTGTGTESAIQNLKMQIANMGFAQADAYLRSLALPEQVRQQLLSGRISELGGLAALEEGSRYRGLMDKLGVNVSQPQYFSQGQPGYPQSPVKNPGNPGGVLGGQARNNRYGSSLQPNVGGGYLDSPGAEYDANDIISNPNANYVAPSVAYGGLAATQYGPQAIYGGDMRGAVYNSQTGYIENPNNGNRYGYVQQPWDDPNSPNYVPPPEDYVDYGSYGPQQYYSDYGYPTD